MLIIVSGSHRHLHSVSIRVYSCKFVVVLPFGLRRFPFNFVDFLMLGILKASFRLLSLNRKVVGNAQIHHIIGVYFFFMIFALI